MGHFSQVIVAQTVRLCAKMHNLTIVLLCDNLGYSTIWFIYNINGLIGKCRRGTTLDVCRGIE